MRTIAITLIACPAVLLAQAPVEYDVSFDNAVHHEARITVTFRDLGDAPLELRMSRSSPGRYAIHEFAKNVYNVWVVDGDGNPLSFTRPNPYQWDVDGHDGTVSVTYTLYGDRAGGTYTGIDATHAHMNMPATFMWARGLDERPVIITFSAQDERWKVATQLVPTEDPFVFTAPDLQYFLDSPTELSDFSERSWQVRSDGTAQTIRLVVHHDGSEDDVDRYADMAKNVVDAQIAVFGEPPRFDYGSYTFIACYLPHASGDGMEHRNSTILTHSRSLHEAEFDQLGTLSHEFIHAWNAERIRPASLEPFDFERANMSQSLWFMEGFTSYYGPLTIHRAGESALADYLDVIGRHIDTVTNSPGRQFASPQGMSIQAPFVDAATSIDPTNFANTFVSYYTYGAALGLALDLSLRDRFEDVTLDTFMRYLWQNFGTNETPYTDDDLRAALGVVSGSERFADEFFRRYVGDSELPDYEALLDRAGLILRKANAGRAWPGPIELEFDGPEAIVGGATIIGTPLYRAGLDRGDRIVAIDRLLIRSERRWQNALGRYEPGDSATIRYIQRGIERSAEITFDEDPGLEVVSYEAVGREPSDEQRDFRRAWLGGP